MTEKTSRHWILCIFVIALGCQIWGAGGVRGTDQYWYLGDAEALTHGNEPHTNIYYPGNILREISTGTSSPNYFTHNGPVLHLAGAMGNHISVYTAWILINIFSHVLVALSIYLVARRYTDLETATWTTCLYLVSPIALWQSMNVLQEQSHAGLMAAIFIAYVFRANIIVLILLALLLALGTTAHPIFFILALLFGLYQSGSGLIKKNIPQAAFGVFITVVFLYLKQSNHTLFPSSFQPTLSAIIAGAVPGKSNIIWQLSDLQPIVTIELLLQKFHAAVMTHFFTPKNAPFFIYTNISLLAFLYLLSTAAKKYSHLLLPIFLSLGLYAAILVLMQTQIRYQQIISPLCFTTIALAAYELRQRLHHLLPVLLLVATSALGYYMAHKNHKEGSMHAMENTALSEKLAVFNADSRLISYDNGNAFDSRLSYLLRPRKLLVIRPEYLDTPDQIKVLRSFKPDHLIAKQPISNKHLPIDYNTRFEISTRSGSIYVYKTKI